MKKTYLLALAFAGLFPSLAIEAQAAIFASQVVDYAPGSPTDVGAYTNPNAALGAPDAVNSAGVFSPFNPNFSTSSLARIGQGGHLTLQLANFVTIDRTAGVPEIGVWENVGLVSTTFPDAHTQSTATVFGADSAIVEVSADDVNWYALNNGNPILFTLPGNYYTNAGAFDSTAPANPQFADFGKPFTGSLSDFDNKDYSQILATLNGSAGGTWLDLDSVPLSQVGFIRFSGETAGNTLEIDAVSINSTLVATAVPEPASLAFLGGCGLFFLGLCRQRRALAALLLAAALAAGTSRVQAQTPTTVNSFDDVKFWIGTGTNRAVLIIDWQDGLNASGFSIGQAVAWGFQWQDGATPTGLDMLNAIAAADSRLHLSLGNNASFGTYLFGVGYDLNNNGGTFTFDSSPFAESGSASDPGDHIQYGFNTNGYWEYLTSLSATTTLPASSGWDYASLGLGSSLVVNNTWDALVFSGYAANPNFDTITPVTPMAATPEPSAFLLAICGGTAVLWRRRRRA